jgi:hypothetical protein
VEVNLHAFLMWALHGDKYFAAGSENFRISEKLAIRYEFMRFVEKRIYWKSKPIIQCD